MDGTDSMVSDSSHKVIVPLSKGKITLILLGSIVFVVMGLWISSTADSQDRFSPLFMKGVSMAAVAFFGLCGIIGCVKLFDDKPGLIIDEQGIVDNSSGIFAGRIPWSEISGFRVSQIMSQRFLTIDVTDPEKYLEKCNSISRFLNTANIGLTGSPINISANALKVSFDDLVRLFTEALEKYRTTDRTRS